MRLLCRLLLGTGLYVSFVFTCQLWASVFSALSFYSYMHFLSHFILDSFLERLTDYAKMGLSGLMA